MSNLAPQVRVSLQSAYRDLFRALRIAFKGDQRMITAAESKVREGFRNPNPNPNPQHQSQSPFQQLKKANDGASAAVSTEDRINEAVQIAKFLRQNVVQGQKMQGQEERYKLRIHEHTERGDNESIKVAGQTVNRDGTIKCCSS